MNTPFNHASVVSPTGDTTHVLVPKSEYDALRAAAGSNTALTEAGPSEDAIAEAIRVMNNPRTKWVDANDVLHDIVSTGVERLRKERGLSQKELADLLGVAQSQVSRYENNADGLTLRVLKKIAEALARAKPHRKSK